MTLLIRTLGRLPHSWIRAVSRLQWRHPLLKRGFDMVADRLRYRDGVIQRGVGKGLLFNNGGSNPGYMLGTTEINLQRAFAMFVRPGMVVYDVGANVGFLSIIAARLVGPSGKVICFEPFEPNTRLIEANARKNGFANVQVKQVALANEDGEASFITSARCNWGKLASVGQPAQALGEQKVQVRRLDTMLRDDNLPPPSVIKIDVEGAETDVFAGATETLRKARPLMFVDLHGTNGAIAEALEKLDYNAHVFGDPDADIVKAPWDSKLIAAPRERTDIRSAMAGLQHDT